ncbi:hypothetical protein SAMN05216464_103343 [Mucilaginibacter pineti]|uniref:Uncharacterized protein n=1 Tax=Mucilaginibacter pineti TaxID=1391627 RepID=A0A1G6ZH16_9SPHI|nr:hypothetical protein [Mucilaginibacter pineti]SDE01547.1 hypothetical protein SAMN05216464_103343 [Mucilaginibacter pineti]
MEFKRKAKRFKAKIRAQAVKLLPSTKGFGYEMPPEKILVEIYFDQKGYPAQARDFYQFYDQANWSSPKGTPFRNWKLLASDWLFNYQQELKLAKRLRTNGLFSGGF